MASGFLARWFGRKRLPSELRYEDARRVLESHQQKAKREKAQRLMRQFQEQAEELKRLHAQAMASTPDEL